MAVFECRQAQEIRDACKKHGVRYLFIGKSAAILLGFPDTTQDADLLLLRTPENCRAILLVLQELGFALTDSLVAEIERGKDFVQLKNGPFDVDLIFAPDGIECFEDAWKRHMEVEGFPVCHIDDVIARSGFKTSGEPGEIRQKAGFETASSKVATHRRKDIESLPRLRAFREY